VTARDAQISSEGKSGTGGPRANAYGKVPARY
jgi:hypothetical protein